MTIGDGSWYDHDMYPPPWPYAPPPYRPLQWAPIQRRGQSAVIGQVVDPDPVEPDKPLTLGSVVKRITPAFILIGIITGMSFAIGSGLTSRLIFRDHKR